MQAPIYITTDAMTTINAIRSLDYYDRVSLSDEPASDYTSSSGYYLNTNALDLVELPADADVAIRLTPEDPATYHRHVSMPANLRGVIFSGAPNLPTDYAESIAFWSPLVETIHHRGALHYQNVMNSYCVQLVDSDCTGDAVVVNDADHVTDVLVSDGLVVSITGLAGMVANLKPEQYVALTIPINPMLGIELEGYRSTEEYTTNPSQQMETLYLRIDDILASPNADQIVLSAIRTELADYGYTY